MDWQTALLWSRVGKAYRMPNPSIDTDLQLSMPQFIERRREGPAQRHVCLSFDHRQIPTSEASRYHDWQPTDPVDAITALGNIDRKQPVWIRPEAEPRGPLEAFLEDNP